MSVKTIIFSIDVGSTPSNKVDEFIASYREKWIPKPLEGERFIILPVRSGGTRVETLVNY